MKSDQATLILRLPAALHQQLKQEARSADLSLNKYCCTLLSRRTRESSAEASPVSLNLTVGGSSRTRLLQDLSVSVLGAWGEDIDGLAIFGSFARGRETANSDIDLLLVLKSNVTLDRDVYSRWQLRKWNGHDVAPLFVKVPGEGEKIGGLWFEVAVDGIVLFDRVLRLSRFLCKARNLIVDGQVRRMVTHGHPYWVYASPVARDLSLMKSL